MTPSVDRTDPGTARKRGAFRLSKWYLDCVDVDGNAAIAYRAVLSWRRVTITWQRATLYPAGREPEERSAIGSVPPPHRAGGQLHWSAPAIECAVECDVTAPTAEHRLLDDATGLIDWRCEAPAARTRFALGTEEPLVGTGYVEHIDLTVPPWRLPIDELRWGRWIAGDASRSVVWIDWRGPKPLTLVLLDGVVQPGAAVSDAGVVLPSGALTLGPRRRLHEESVREVVASVPGLARLFRAARLAMRDDKWCAPGTCTLTGESPLRGWVIHETVWFK